MKRQSTRPIRIGRFGLLENPIGLQVTWKQHLAGCGKAPRTMLADVVGCYYREFPSAYMLKVRHFNGDELPDIVASTVRVLDREWTPEDERAVNQSDALGGREEGR